MVADSEATSTEHPDASKSINVKGCLLQKRDFAQRRMSMRNFLEPFDHSSLTNKEASEKYAAYKASFARQQLEEFFERNKGHAWFREKYHPDFCQDILQSQKYFKRRLNVFIDIYEKGLLDNIHLTSGYEKLVARLLDIVAVKLADGGNDDVELLYEFYESGLNTDYDVVKQLQLSENNIGILDNQALKKIGSTDVHDTQKVNNMDKYERKKSKRSDQKRPELTEKLKKQNNITNEEEGEDTSFSDHSSATSGDSSSSSESNSSELDTSSSSSGGESSDENDDDEGIVKESQLSGSNNAEIRNLDNLLDGNNNDDDITERRRSQSESKGDCLTNDNDNVLQEHINTPVGPRRPIHCTVTLFLPHIPLNVFRRDLEALFSTSPHFLRLAILDPVILPEHHSHNQHRRSYSNQLGSLSPTKLKNFASLFTCSSDPVANPDSKVQLLIKRVGWASFRSQHYDADLGRWIDVDLHQAKAKFVQQLVQAQAPSELVECIRCSCPVRNWSPIDLIKCRVTNRSELFAKYLQHDPERLKLKSCFRRHLVMAARLTAELDCARGLWTVDDADVVPSKANESLDLVSDPAVVQTNDDPVVAHDKNQSTELEELQMSIDQDETMDDTTINKENSEHGDFEETDSTKAKENQPTEKENITKPKHPSDFIDPGDDLLKAASILNSLSSKNPLLQNLMDYLIDEGSAEEELLLLSGGVQSMSFVSNSRNNFELVPGSDPIRAQQPNEQEQSEFMIALDRLILYLRIVHSVDFYAPALYPMEDLMPHPCRLIHIRPNLNEIFQAIASKAPKLNKLKSTTAIQRADQTFFAQLKRLIGLAKTIKPSECQGLGFRDPDEVAEAFIKANTRKKKRKTDIIWVCPLSNKKFRDPIFVKKHILNKHMDKVEIAKNDNALFFNNYLLDPARPQLPLEPLFRRYESRSQSPSPDRNLAVSNRTNNGRENPQSWTQYSMNNAPQPVRLGPVRYPYVRRDFDQSNNAMFGGYRPRYPANGSQYPRYGGAPWMGYGQNVKRRNRRRYYVDLDAV